MKHLQLVLMAIGSLFILSLASCSFNCRNVNCENGGTCDDGTCECLDGYSGENCEIADLCTVNSISCLNDGVCVNGLCQCAEDYYGPNCSVHCVNGTYDGTSCDCDPGYKGAGCEIYCANGTYDGTSCICDAGYEGDGCDVESRAKFYGSYNTTGSIECPVSGSAPVSLTTIFSASTASPELMLVNIGEGALIMNATVDGSAFTFMEATQSSFTYTGTGSIVGTTVTYTLNEYDPSVPETCVYSMSGSIQ